MFKIFFLSLTIFLFCQFAESGTWLSVEAKYSKVEYISGNEKTADSLLKLSELAIPRLSRIFGIPLSTIEKQKVRIILTGEPDVSNGYALADAVVIYELSSEYMLTNTGTRPWYARVLFHELAHYFTFIKIKRKFNFFGEFANLTLPRWFYEGIAQYYTENWTTFRGDIYLRNAVLNGKLTYSALGNLENGRLLYAAAHGFIRYLADQYGDSTLTKLMSYNADGWYLNFDDAFRSVYKDSPEVLFTKFIRHLVLYYGDMLSEYPIDSFSKQISFGFRTFQVVPVSVKDSTWLAIVQEKSNHRYRSLVLAEVTGEKSKIKRVFTRRIHTNFVLSDDREWVAFGRTNTKISNDQISLSFDWVIMDLQTGNEKVILRDSKARNAAMSPDGNLVICETSENKTLFRQYSPVRKSWKLLFETQLPAGMFTIDHDGSIIFAGQNGSGQRDLYYEQDNHIHQLTNDREDDRNPILISDSLVVFNRFEDLNPTVAVYNLNTRQFKTLLNLQDAFWVRGYDKNSRNLLLSETDVDQNQRFIYTSLDSLLETQLGPSAFTIKKEYHSWTLVKPSAADVTKLPDTTIVRTKREKLRFPQGYLIHLFSFALPAYDENLGFGIYGITSWAEALQRQALAGSFILFSKKPEQSLVLISHALVAFNSTFLTSWYHGPVLFSHQDGKYINLYQDYLGINWGHKYFFNGNGRTQFEPSVSYAMYHYKLNEPFEDFPNDFSYHGPKIGFTYSYLLPTSYFPALPKRQFDISAHYFKSFEPKYNFGVSQIDLKMSSNILTENLGIESNTTWIGGHGNFPEIQSIGIDRFYEFDSPRDFRFSKPVRGVRQDLSGSGLLWQSTELKWFISRKTGTKLIFLPINNLAAGIFFDYAKISGKKDIDVSGYGFELSFGEDLYRLGTGYVFSNPYNTAMDEQIYFRLKLFIPTL